MPIIEIIRNTILAVLGTLALIQYGPPIVDRHFLPTIGYVADTFLAIAPLPPPSTTLVSKQPPLAVARTPVVLKTIFVEPAVHGTDSSRTRTTITAMNHGRESGSHRNPSYWGGSFFHYLSTILEWWARIIYGVPHRILLYLRQLLDYSIVLISFLIAPVISWQLSNIRNQTTMERITAAHEMEIAGVNEESSTTASARDLLITALQGQIQAQESRLNEAQAEISAKNLAEGELKSEIASLGSKLTDRDNEIAGLSDNLTEATSRADAAELSNKTIEKKAKAARSDHDSALQKKENEVNTHKNAREKAAEDRDTARSELKAARAEASQDKKRITKLQKQVTEAATNASGFEDQLKQKDAIIGQKDGIIRRMREEATRSSKEARNAKATDRDHLRELQGQIANANKLREDAEAKASRKEQESKAKDDKIEDYKTSVTYRERRITSLEASHEKLRAAYENEQAEARDAAAKAQETEDALQKRVAQLEEQIQAISALSNVAAPNSDASTQERSTSSRPNLVVPFSGPRRPRYVAPANGETFADPEVKGLPADTPRGPKVRGGSRGGRDSGRGRS